MLLIFFVSVSAQGLSFVSIFINLTDGQFEYVLQASQRSALTTTPEERAESLMLTLWMSRFVKYELLFHDLFSLLSLRFPKRYL